MLELTHRDLVDRAVRWCRSKRHTVVVAEPSSWRKVGCEPDVFASHPSLGTTMIEVKRSRSDFQADKRKWSHENDAIPGERRWYFTPAGLLSPDDLPDGWGLAEVRGRGVRVVVEASRVELGPASMRTEREILLALAARHHREDAFDPKTGRFVPMSDLVPETASPPASRKTEVLVRYGRRRAANRVAAAVLHRWMTGGGLVLLDPVPGTILEPLASIVRSLANRGGASTSGHRAAKLLERDPECWDLRHHEPEQAALMEQRWKREER